jgi:hypothetical protein
MSKIPVSGGVFDAGETARTVAVIPAAADEVSVGIAHLFSQHVVRCFLARAGITAASGTAPHPFIRLGCRDLDPKFMSFR